MRGSSGWLPWLLPFALVGCADSDVAPGMGGAPGTSSGGSGGSAAAPQDGRFFPADAWMYQDVSNARVHAQSSATTAWLTSQGGWGLGRMQIDFSIVVLEAAAAAPRREFTATDDFYTPDCDQVPVPIPAGGALEGETAYSCDGDGDCHLIVVDRDAGRLYEMWRADIDANTFRGGCLAVWNMGRTYAPEGRGEQCSSADAAGFPIAPLLFYPNEVAAGAIEHAIRFILPNARMKAKTYVRPASHAGGPSAQAATAPVYGSRWRLKASLDVSALPTAGARTVARALQKYGMVLADGGNVALTAASDRFSETKWEGLLGTRDLAMITPDHFEVLDTGPEIPLTYDCVRTPY